MKTFLMAAASACAASACASDPDPLTSKQLAAAEIAYDNGGAGLVSTNVQDAIDDVVAMAQTQDERMTNAVIVCKWATANLTLPSTGNPMFVPHVFSVAECGGKLPDASYVGALSRFTSCNYVMSAYVANVGEADGPGVVVRSFGGCSGRLQRTSRIRRDLLQGALRLRFDSCSEHLGEPAPRACEQARALFVA
jgi:hypothetical protein